MTHHDSDADARDLDDIVEFLKELKVAIQEFRLVQKKADDPLFEAWNQFVSGERDRTQSAADLSVLTLQQNFADLSWQAVYLVRWFDHASLADATRSAEADPAIKPFVEGLANLSQQIEAFVRKSSKQPLPDKVYQPLIKQCAELQEQFARIREGLDGDRSTALNPGALPPAAVERLAEDLLRTPLLSARDRVSLYPLLRPAGESAPPEAAGPSPTKPWDPAQTKLIKWWEGTSTQWRAVRERTDLHLGLMRLSRSDISKLSPSVDRLTNLPEKLDEKLSVYRDVGRELGNFYAGLPGQVADKQLDPFHAWCLAQLVDGLDLADRRDQESRLTGFVWELRVLRNPGRIDFAAEPALSLFEEDFVPLRIIADGWPGDMLALDVALDFDPQRVEVRSPDGKSLKPRDPVTVSLLAGKGQGQLVLAAKWKGPKSPTKEARQTKMSVSIVVREDLASFGSPSELTGEWQGARPFELAIRRHGPKGMPMPPVLEATGGTARPQDVSRSADRIRLVADQSHALDEMAVSVQLLAVPALPAPAGAAAAEVVRACALRPPPPSCRRYWSTKREKFVPS